MSRNGGILSGGFNGLRAPSAPAITGVTTSIGSATVAFTPPTDVGDAAVSSYVVTAVDESTGASTGATGSASPITVTPPAGGTFKIRMQALNAYGPGRLTEYDTGNAIYGGAELYAWGSNQIGRLGDNSTQPRSSPVQIGALTTWSKISAGATSIASIKSNGTLWMWGDNLAGSLGQNNTIHRSSPVQVGSLTDWYLVACGVGGGDVVLAVKTNGTLWSWGGGDRGGLASGNQNNKSSPTQVGSLTNWSQPSAGEKFGAAVKTDGTLWSWGLNYSGQLGDGTRTDRLSPVQVGALTDWAKVQLAGSHTLAIKTNGTLWAWGSNNRGQLGNNTSVDRSSPVQVGALTNWSQVSSRGQFNSAIKSDGTLWTWGYNYTGELGINVIGNASSPVQVGALTNWSVTAVGIRHGMAVKTDGTLWTWGRNEDFGTLGDDTMINKSSPIQIGALTNWASVSGGEQTSIALLGVV